MPTFTELPSGKWRVQIRRRGFYRNATFDSKREALYWAAGVESQAVRVVAGGVEPVPRGVTVATLIDGYLAASPRPGRTKAMALGMLRRELGRIAVSALSAAALREFIDRRLAGGAGGVTIAADLSFLSSVLKWARRARRLDVPDRVALEARVELAQRGVRTRAEARERAPTADELQRLLEHWQANPRQRIDMAALCRFALASGMRQEEICRLEVDDVDPAARTIVVRDRQDRPGKAPPAVPLLPEAWAIVEPRLEGRAGQRLFGDVRAASVSTAFKRACKAVGIDDLRFHDLRHAAAARFFRMGLDVPRVALLTGHRTWAVLRRHAV